MKKNYFVLLGISLFFSLDIFSQIVNEGTLYIESSTTVYFGDEYTNNGTHNSNGDLFLNSNFVNNDSTSSTSGTTFFKSSLNNIQTISGLKNKVNFYNLEVDNNLTGVQVVDNFCIYVNNAVNLGNGDFRLIGEAQLIQTHNGANANSAVSGKLLRDQQGNKSAYGYNYWSSPVNNGGSFSLSGGLFDGTDASINPFSSQQVQFIIGDPFNGLPSVTDGSGNVTTPLTLNKHWFFKFSR
ncbi:MAG: ABC transporter permease, partial [Aureibaculum sp.]